MKDTVSCCSSSSISTRLFDSSLDWWCPPVCFVLGGESDKQFHNCVSRTEETEFQNPLELELIHVPAVLPLYFSSSPLAYKTVSGVNGPLVILDQVKVSIRIKSLNQTSSQIASPFPVVHFPLTLHSFRGTQRSFTSRCLMAPREAARCWKLPAPKPSCRWASLNLW